MIPKQLKNLKFCRIKKGTKNPFEMDWVNKNHSYEEISKFFPKENYGVVCGHHDLAVIDCDEEVLDVAVKTMLPKTFSVKTGNGGMHYYYFIPELKNKVILKIDDKHLGEIQSYGSQVIGAGSTHPNKNTYELLGNVGIKKISLKELKDVLGKFMLDNSTELKTEGKVDDYKNLIFEIAKKWNEGNRQELALSVAGYLRKEKRLGIKKTKEIITEVCRICQDEELKMRLRAVDETYKKDEKDIKGIKGFLEFDIKPQKEQPNKEFLDILKNPNLFEIINDEFDKQITGEQKSRKAIFLSLCSIFVKNIEIPLNTFVSSESSAGKSYVCKKIIKIFPKDLIEYRSKITGEAFTYWHTNTENWSWDGKICYLEDVKQDILDSATFKIMCSEGSIATIVKNQKAIDLFVNGKPCMLITTAGTNPATELLNRFNIITLDESAKQTKNITLNQALEIKDEEYHPHIVNSLNFLKRVNVSVPFAPQIHKFITKNYSWNDVRMRRDFSRLRDLIKCSTALYQFQREPDEKGRLIANKEDYEIARECINYIQTTTLKGLTHKLKKTYDICVKKQEFTAKEIHAEYPFVSLKMWYIYLQNLCERKLLKTELRDIEDSKKRVTIFLVPKTFSFNLPFFDELPEYSVTNVTINTINKNNTNVTNDNKNIITNVRNVTILSKKGGIKNEN